MDLVPSAAGFGLIKFPRKRSRDPKTGAKGPGLCLEKIKDTRPIAQLGS